MLGNVLMLIAAIAVVGMVIYEVFVNGEDR